MKKFTVKTLKLRKNLLLFSILLLFCSGTKVLGLTIPTIDVADDDTVIANSIMSVTLTPASAIVCNNNTVLLTVTGDTAPGGVLDNWYKDGALILSGGSSNTYSATQPGTYKVIAFEQGNEFNYAESNNSVITEPFASVNIFTNANETSFCATCTPQLRFNVSSSFPTLQVEIEIISGGTTTHTVNTYSSGTTQTINMPAINVTTTYRISKVIGSGGCEIIPSNIPEITYTRNFPPSTIITGPTEVCAGESATLTVEFVNPPANPANYSYLWSTTETTQSISVTPGTAQTYMVTVTDLTTGCSVTTSHNIKVNPLPKPIIAIPPQQAYCPNTPPTVMVGSPLGGSFYLVDCITLNIIEPISNVFDPNYIYTTHGPGIFCIQYYYTDTNGCTGKSVPFTTEVKERPNVWIQNLPPIISRDSGPVYVIGRPQCHVLSSCQFVMVSPATGLNYDVSLPGTLVINPAASPDPVGFYQIEYHYSDGNGCNWVATGEFQIVDIIGEPFEIDAFITPQHISCPGDNNGVLSISILRGNPPYDIECIGGNIPPNTLISGTYNNFHQITGLYPGAYYIKISDATGAEWSKIVTLTEPEFFEIVPNWIKNISCSHCVSASKS